MSQSTRHYANTKGKWKRMKQKTGTESGKLEWKAESGKLKTGNGCQIMYTINCMCACSNDNIGNYHTGITYH